MKQLAPPLCLLLALAALIASFTLLAGGAPEAGVDMQVSQFRGDDGRRETLERRLRRRQRSHRLLVAGLLTGAVVLTVAAFRLMQPSRPEAS